MEFLFYSWHRRAGLVDPLAFNPVRTPRSTLASGGLHDEPPYQSVDGRPSSAVDGDAHSDRLEKAVAMRARQGPRYPGRAQRQTWDGAGEAPPWMNGFDFRLPEGVFRNWQRKPRPFKESIYPEMTKTDDIRALIWNVLSLSDRSQEFKNAWKSQNKSPA